MRSVIITLLIGSSLLFSQKPTGGGGGSAEGGAPHPPTGSIQLDAGSGMFGALGAVIPTSTMGLTAGDTGDNGPIFNATIAAATGDTVFLCDTPGSTYRVTTQIVFPAYTNTPFATHYNFRFTGIGNYFPWQSYAALPNGCTIDLEYTGYGGGAIYGSAYGGLEWDHWTIAALHSPMTKWTIGSNLTSIIISGTYPNQIGTVTVTTPTQTLNAGNYVQILGATVNASLNTTYPVTSNTSGTVFVIGNIPYGISNATYTDAGMSINYTPAMIYLTNTEPIFHDLYVTGDTSLGLAANNQDFMLLGGTNNENNTTLDSSFGGYGGSIRNIGLDYVRRNVYLRQGANQLLIENLYANPTSTGSNDGVNGSAIEEDTGAGVNTYLGNTIGGQYVHGFLVGFNATGGSSITGTHGGNICCAGGVMYQVNSINNTTLITALKADGLVSGSGNFTALLADGPKATLQTNGASFQFGPPHTFIVNGTTGYPGLYNGTLTPSGTNYALLAGSSGDTYVNGGTDLYMDIGGSTIGHLTSSGFAMAGVPSTLSIATGTIASPPATPHTGQLVYFTDAATTVDCTVGGGTAHSMCAYNGAAWAKP